MFKGGPPTKIPDALLTPNPAQRSCRLQHTGLGVAGGEDFGVLPGCGGGRCWVGGVGNSTPLLFIQGWFRQTSQKNIKKFGPQQNVVDIWEWTMLDSKGVPMSPIPKRKIGGPR